MIIYRTKYKDILSEFAFTPGTKPHHAVILCEGLPAAPKRQETIEYLVNRGFVVFYPRYKGTWESDGEFLSENPVSDIRDIVTLIKSGKVRELYNMETFTFEINRISLISSSFGGAIGLSASTIPDIQKIIALSPVVDFNSFNTKYQEQDLEHLGKFILRAFTNGYRFSPMNWQNLLSGKLINPAEYMTNETVEKVLIVQCKDDSSVSYIPVVEFAERYGIKYNLLDTGGHLSFSKISNETWADIIKWIR